MPLELKFETISPPNFWDIGNQETRDQIGCQDVNRIPIDLSGLSISYVGQPLNDNRSPWSLNELKRKDKKKRLAFLRAA